MEVRARLVIDHQAGAAHPIARRRPRPIVRVHDVKRQAEQVLALGVPAHPAVVRRRAPERSHAGAAKIESLMAHVERMHQGSVHPRRAGFDEGGELLRRAYERHDAVP